MAEDIAPQGVQSQDASPEVKQEARKFRVKVDGADADVDEGELISGYQKQVASDKKFQEAARMRREFEKERGDMVERLKSGDLDFLKDHLDDDSLDGWAEKRLLRKLQWEQLPEPERRAQSAEKKAQELEAKIHSITQSAQDEEMTRMEEQIYSEIEDDIVEAVREMGAGRKVTPRLVRRIAESLYADLEASESNGSTKRLTAKEARDRAVKGLREDAQEFLESLSDDEAMELVPKKIKEALRKMNVDKAKEQSPFGRSGPESRDYKEKPSKFKKETLEERFKKMDKKFS